MSAVAGALRKGIEVGEEARAPTNSRHLPRSGRLPGAALFHPERRSTTENLAGIKVDIDFLPLIVGGQRKHAVGLAWNTARTALSRVASNSGPWPLVRTTGWPTSRWLRASRMRMVTT